MTVVVSWSPSETTLARFEDYITEEFKDLSMFIALRAVHNSDLTFKCTVPVWAIGAISSAAFGLGYALKGIQQFILHNEVIYVSISYNNVCMYACISDSVIIGSTY